VEGSGSTQMTPKLENKAFSGKSTQYINWNAIWNFIRLHSRLPNERSSLWHGNRKKHTHTERLPYASHTRKSTTELDLTLLCCHYIMIGAEQFLSWQDWSWYWCCAYKKVQWTRALNNLFLVLSKCQCKPNFVLSHTKFMPSVTLWLVYVLVMTFMLIMDKPITNI
jgi:hypothetical protein